MYLLYVDESGDSGRRGSKHLLLGGAALFEGKWRSVQSELAVMLERYFPNVADRPRELHCTDIRRGRSAYSQLTPRDRQALLDDACGMVNALGPTEVALFTVVFDKAWWFSRNAGKSGDDLYLELFENLVARFDLFLRRRYRDGQPAKGLIIADPSKPALSKALRTAVLQFHQTGTRWAQLHNVIESVLFLESHESPGLQLADLCSYAVWRAAEYDDAGLAIKLKNAFDREALTATVNPGKWHGIRYDGPHNSPVRAIFQSIWPAP